MAGNACSPAAVQFLLPPEAADCPYPRGPLSEQLADMFVLGFRRRRRREHGGWFPESGLLEVVAGGGVHCSPPLALGGRLVFLRPVPTRPGSLVLSRISSPVLERGSSRVTSAQFPAMQSEWFPALCRRRPEAGRRYSTTSRSGCHSGSRWPTFQ